MADVLLPQLGETVTEGTITRWFFGVGERVPADAPLYEISTEKVDSEVPAPGAGVLTEIVVPEGETVEVGVVLAVIGDAAAKVDETALAGFGKFSGKEDTGPRRTQSPHRRADNHQGRQQHRLPARQGAQGQRQLDRQITPQCALHLRRRAGL